MSVLANGGLIAKGPISLCADIADVSLVIVMPLYLIFSTLSGQFPLNNRKH